MSDPRSALSGDPLAVPPPADAKISMEEVHPFSLVQIAAWPDTIATVAAFGAKLAGCKRAPRASQAVAGQHGTLLRIEPLKWWAISDRLLGDDLDLASDTGAILELSDTYTWIKIGGTEAETLLNHFLPLDLREGAFPIDSAASTAFQHVGVKLWRDTAGYNLLIPRSFARSLFEHLIESSRQYLDSSDWVVERIGSNTTWLA